MPSEYFQAIDQSPKTLVLILVFMALCLYFVGLYFYVQKPKKGTIEWIQTYQKRTFEPFTYEPLTYKDVLFCFLTFFVALILCTLRVLIHHHLGLIDFFFENTRQMLLTGAVATLALTISFYGFFRLFYTSRFVAGLVTCLSCALFSREMYSVILLLFSWIFLFLWICNNYRNYKRIHALYFILAIVFYAFTLMSCWAAIHLIPIYAGGIFMGKYLQWHRGDQEKKKGMFLFSVFLIFITFGIILLVMWLLYYAYNNQNMNLITTMVSGEVYKSIIPTFLEKMADIALPKRPMESNTVRIVRQDLFRPVLFITSLFPAIYYGFVKKKSQALTAVFCAVLFLSAWIISGVDIMCPGAMLSIGWMFKGFRDRGYKRYAVFLSVAVLAFYFTSLMI